MVIPTNASRNVGGSAMPIVMLALRCRTDYLLNITCEKCFAGLL